MCYLPLTTLLLKPLHRVLHYQLLLERNTFYYLINSYSFQFKVMSCFYHLSFIRVLVILAFLSHFRKEMSEFEIYIITNHKYRDQHYIQDFHLIWRLLNNNNNGTNTRTVEPLRSRASWLHWHKYGFKQGGDKSQVFHICISTVYVWYIVGSIPYIINHTYIWSIPKAISR